MINSYRLGNSLLLALVFVLALGLSAIALAADTPEQLEEQGLEFERTAVIYGNNAVPPEIPLLDSLPAQDVLLIPNTTGDYVGTYDPYDGTFLGIFVSGSEFFSTPVNAVQGPDGNIYVTDQLLDAIRMFDRQGNSLGDYANASDGLDNIRGIEFRADGHLFVCTYADGIIEFDGPHSQIGVFVPSTQSQWDIKFLDDGTALVSSSGTNNVVLYNADGSPAQTLYQTRFPEQINKDLADNDTYLNTSMTADTVRDFRTDGMIDEITILDASRGVFRLGNGNLLVTSGAGVYEVQPGTNIIVETQNTNANYFIELCTYTPAGSDSAEIDLSMTAIVDTVDQGSSSNVSLGISNLGDATLYYVFYWDSSWVNITPTAGQVLGSQVDSVGIHLSATEHAPGTYLTEIRITSNDSDEALIAIPLTMVVEEPPSGCAYIPRRHQQQRRCQWYRRCLRRQLLQGQQRPAGQLRYVPAAGSVLRCRRCQRQLRLQRHRHHLLRQLLKGYSTRPALLPELPSGVKVT